MELDLTTIVDQTAEKMWDARLMLTGKSPWAETDLDTKNKFKDSLLPPIFHSSEFVAKAVGQGVVRVVSTQREDGVDDKTILDLLLLRLDTWRLQ